MGNIVTPEQGLLPIPAAAAGSSLSTIPYPWWLNSALVIWALAALLCCWLLLLLYLLRYCCKLCRRRRYAAEGRLLEKQALGAGSAQGREGFYAEQNIRTASAPPIPPFPIASKSGAVFQDIYERRTVQDDFYGNAIPYVATAVAGASNAGFESGSESFSEEEIQDGNRHKTTKTVHVIEHSPQAITVVADRAAGGIKENFETNVERNIKKNYFINEEKNYYIQNDPIVETTNYIHDQSIQKLPGPVVTTVNMAAERITDNPNWENAHLREDFRDPKPNRVLSELVHSDPTLFRQNVTYEKQPNVYTHRPVTPNIPRILNQRSSGRPVVVPESSTTSEMSGHDSESIYETIRVLSPRKLPLNSSEDDDDYKTAGIDELEIEINDLVRLQRANPKSTTTYDDILATTHRSRKHLTPHSISSSSSSSTLNDMSPVNTQRDQSQSIAGDEAKEEETVTETVKTEQIQTTIRQIGQQLDDSAFFIPLPTSSTHHEERRTESRQLLNPTSPSSTHFLEQQNEERKFLSPFPTATTRTTTTKTVHHHGGLQAPSEKLAKSRSSSTIRNFNQSNDDRTILNPITIDNMNNFEHVKGRDRKTTNSHSSSGTYRVEQLNEDGQILNSMSMSNGTRNFTHVRPSKEERIHIPNTTVSTIYEQQESDNF